MLKMEALTEMLKIMYDFQAFGYQKYGGVSRYFYEVISQLRNHSGIETEIKILFSESKYLSDSYKFKIDFDFKGKIKFYNFINKIYSSHILKKNDYTIFHPTYYDPYFLGLLDDKPFVLTIHDMIHEKYSECFEDKIAEQKRVLAEKADRIIAVSHNTKKDIIDILKIPSEKIDVVYHGVSIKPDKEESVQLPEDCILYVGARKPAYKNFNFLLKAFASYIKYETDVNLFCIGGGEFESIEKEYIESLNLTKKVFQMNLTDNQMAIAYKNAVCFVYPSLYEGFGIPILEAFTCCCPVLLANRSSFPEVAKDGALYFDPGNESELIDLLLRVRRDNQIRREIVNKGEKISRDYTWKKSSLETINVYKKVINE